MKDILYNDCNETKYTVKRFNLAALKIVLYVLRIILEPFITAS